MNTNSNNLPLDEGRLDRLVDGELSEPERRELLAGLDSEPGGWRRCALAFLESQCWKQSVGDLWSRAKDEPGEQTAAGKAAVASRRSLLPGHVGTLLAMAASFLVAFGVFSTMQQLHRGGTADVARGTVGRPVGAADRSLASMSGGAPLRMVTVSAPGEAGNGRRTLQVPAVERNKIDPGWWQQQANPPAIPDDVLAAFNRTGHQVEQHRELVPVRLDDGRQMVMPVDQVNVHYVGNGETY